MVTARLVSVVLAERHRLQHGRVGRRAGAARCVSRGGTTGNFCRTASSAVFTELDSILSGYIFPDRWHNTEAGRDAHQGNWPGSNRNKQECSPNPSQPISALGILAT